MRVALTGATGFIGSHILAELQGHGHEVTALVRDDAQADIVAERGAISELRILRPPLVRQCARARQAPSPGLGGEESILCA